MKISKNCILTGKSICRILIAMFLIAAMLMGCGSSSGPAAGEATNQQELVVVSKNVQTGGQTTESQEEVEEASTDTAEETQEAIQEAVQESAVGSESPKTAGEALVDADGRYANGSPYTKEQALKLLFRKKSNRDQHYEKHGIEMGFASAEDYLQAAREVVANPNALHKIEKEDGDDVYFIEETSEFVVVSSDGYLRTYFIPSAGKKYYDRQ